MKVPISQSKITAPRFPHVLHRPRLIELLEQQRDKKLILILGPAAQGKSTLAVSWINTSDTPVAWINLGAEDGDPVSLFYLLVQALERALPHRDFSLLLTYPALTLGPREEIPLYRDWANSIFSLASQPIWIILDGLDQLSPAPPTYRFMQVLLDEAPPDVHFLMLSREMPPLKLEALKMRQGAFILTAEELAFTLAETRKFLKVRRFSLPPRSVRQIHRLTEGWAGGLVLFSEGMARMPETDRKEYLLEDLTEKFKGDVFKYFGEQVFVALPPGTQEFLVKSAFLEVVDPDFIKVFLGMKQTRVILDDLAQRNLFIQPLYDKKRGWLYRYHLLFREFLYAKFETLGADTQRAAYLRAGELSDQRGELDEAVKYYLKAEAYPQAASAIEQVGPQRLKMSKTAELAQWLSALPNDLVQRNPWLLFYHFITGRFTGRKEYLFSLKQAYDLFHEQQDLRGLLLTSTHLLELSIFLRDPSLPLASQVKQAEELLHRIEPKAFPNESAALWLQVGLAKMFSLDIRQGYWACRQAYLLAKEAGEKNLEIYALTNASAILTMLGEFRAAQEADQQGEALLARYYFPDLETLHHARSGYLKLAQGELEKGEALCNKALEEAEKYGLTSLYPLTRIFQAISLGYIKRYREALEIFVNLLKIPTLSNFAKGLAAAYSAIFSYHTGDLPAARQFTENAWLMLSSEAGRAEYYLRAVKIFEALIFYHLGEFNVTIERELQETLQELTEISSYLWMPDAHWTMALWRWRQGQVGAAAEHIKAGMEGAATRGSYFSMLLSPRDRARIFTLALELEMEEFWDRLPPLLVPLADLAEPELTRLAKHANPKVAAQAAEIRLAIHRSGVPRLRIQTLGGFRVWRGESPMEEKAWEGNQPKLLLKALVANGHSEMPKDVIIEDLWPEMAPEVTEQNFKVALHRLRKSLEPAMDRAFGSAYVHLKANLVSLDPEFCQVDVNEFLRLYKIATRNEAHGHLKEALNFYNQALELYGGNFLPEELYLPWAEVKREELRTTYLDLLRRLARLQETRGSLTKAIDCYKRLLQADPLSDEPYQKLMLLYAQKGMRTAALKVYEDCCQALQQELHTDPDAATTAIYRKILELPQAHKDRTLS